MTVSAGSLNEKSISYAHHASKLRECHGGRGGKIVKSLRTGKSPAKQCVLDITEPFHPRMTTGMVFYMRPAQDKASKISRID